MRLRYLTFFLLSLALTGCRFLRSDASIQVQALDGKGAPLAGANIIIDKVLVGKTDHQGIFRTSMELPTSEPVLVEVNKPSEAIFYAPYFENIQVQRADANVFKLKAILYGVTKDSAVAEEPATPAEEEGNAEESSEASAEENTLTVSQAPEASAAAAATPATATAAPIPTRPLTFYVGSLTDQIAGASIFFGDRLHKQWAQGCETNPKGRCTISVPENQDRLSLLVRAKGYQSQIREIHLDEGDKIRFQMQRGRGLEFFALSAVGVEGIEGIELSAKDKKICTTDYFGSCLVSAEQLDDATEVTLSSSGWLPGKISKNIASGQLLVQHYQPLKPRGLRVAVLPLLRYELDGASLREWEQPMQSVTEALNDAGAEVIKKDELDNALHAKNIRLEDLSLSGWNQLPLDFVIRATLINSKQPRLTLSAIKNDGSVAAGVARDLGSQPSEKQLEAAAFDLLQQLPREGAIVDVVKDDYQINLGGLQGIQKGESLSLHGSNSNEIAEAIVTEVGDNKARVHIIERKSDSKVEIGQRAYFARQHRLEGRTTSLTVKNSSEALAQAEIFSGNRWLGSTGKDGQVTIREIAPQAEIMVLRVGYTPKIIAGEKLTTSSIVLEHDNIPIRIESNPGNALVRMNDREVGRTPLDISIPFPGRTVKLEVGSVEGFRDSVQTVQIGDAGLTMTGGLAIALEKDPRAAAEKALREGKNAEAVSILETIPVDDPAYLISQHQLGEIFLNRLFEPLKAAEAFHRVTTKVQYSDKRFIGTYINEAVALFQAGEKAAAADRNLAISYWRQSIAILDKTEEQLRYVPSEQYNQAVHTLSYYRALSSHKVFLLTQNPDDKTLALKQWKDYIEGTALAIPQDKHSGWVKKAEDYFRELQTESHARANRNKPQG